MEKQIFKVGDRVYHIDYGWGVVFEILNSGNTQYPIGVRFDNEEVSEYFLPNGGLFTYSKNRSLSFTEYTLQGFSQERPIELPGVGELCLVRNGDNHEWLLREFLRYDKNALHTPYIVKGGVGYRQMKRIKILD